MTIQKIYTLLNEAGAFSSKDFDPLKMQAIKEALQLEIASEANKETTSKKRLAAIKKHFDKIGEKKPVLNGYTTVLQNYYTFTDSFMLCSLKQADFNGVNLKDNTTNYPDIRKICDYDNFKNYPLSFTIKVNNLLNEIKLNNIYKESKNNIITKNIVKITLNDGSIVGFECKLLKLFIESMNFKPNETITFYSKKTFTPFFTENQNGSKGMIMPVRLD